MENMSESQTKVETLEHIRLVDELLKVFISCLLSRGCSHDSSKLSEKELPIFCKYTPLLKTTEYGTDEYKKYLKEMKPALDHHYDNNRHHPEHFTIGISGMNLIDIIEMFCDWVAATKRQKNGNIKKSILQNKDRFMVSDQLENIFLNTVEDLKLGG